MSVFYWISQIESQNDFIHLNLMKLEHSVKLEHSSYSFFRLSLTHSRNRSRTCWWVAFWWDETKWNEVFNANVIYESKPKVVAKVVAKIITKANFDCYDNPLYRYIYIYADLCIFKEKMSIFCNIFSPSDQPTAYVHMLKWVWCEYHNHLHNTH